VIRDPNSGVVAVVVGARPGIIKMSPVVRELERVGAEFFIAHSGQHYSFNMDKQFFDDLHLPAPRFTNPDDLAGTSHGRQTASMLIALEDAFLDGRPELVIVGGDANTSLAAALAARKLGLIVAHLESGLRSHDWRMPEEHNRVIIDHVSDVLFCPTELARDNLVADGVRGEIVVTGNTVVDAVLQNAEIARSTSDIRARLELTERDYFVLTFHREENTDDPGRLRSLVDCIQAVSERFRTPIIFPVHPRTVNRLEGLGLDTALASIDNLHLTSGLGYLDFAALLGSARLVMTDSGGIQEEACALRVPCVTLRDNTERPETLDVGSNAIAGVVPDSVVRSVEEMLRRPRDWRNPFGDGHAAERVVETCLARLGSQRGALAGSA